VEKLRYVTFNAPYFRTDVFITVPLSQNKKAYKILNAEK